MEAPVFQEVDAYYRENWQQYRGIGDHFHYFHELIFLKAGVAEFVVNGKRYTALANDLILIGNLERHEIHVIEYPYNAYLFSISNDLCLLHIREPQLLSMLLHHTSADSHQISLDAETAARLTSFLDEAVQECREKKPMWQTQAALLLEEMLLTVYRAERSRFSAEQDAGATDLVLQAQKYIARNYAHEISLDSLAAQCYVSKYHLSRTFKEITGYGFKEYLILYRLNEAKKLLSSTERSVTDICYDTGYKNINHFIRIFRMQEGITPLQYRKLYWESVADNSRQEQEPNAL
ncbi:MAG: AraC family transcriptional regulator [Provencibacterium sp.]|jgi:AraC-like DNA-binding protein|nr:AraC family transcriptional regulator [Provencibacterium sp.]